MPEWLLDKIDFIFTRNKIDFRNGIWINREFMQRHICRQNIRQNDVATNTLSKWKKEFMQQTKNTFQQNNNSLLWLVIFYHAWYRWTPRRQDNWRYWVVEFGSSRVTPLDLVLRGTMEMRKDGPKSPINLRALKELVQSADGRDSRVSSSQVS